MKKMYKMMLVAILLIASVPAMKAAPDMPQISEGATEHWYHILFQRTANDNSKVNRTVALQQNGEDAILTSGTFNLGADNQLWKLSKVDGKDDRYILTSKAGGTAYYDDSRFKAGATSSELWLAHSTAGAPIGTDAWVIGLDDNEQSMNPNGGNSNDSPIGLWDNDDQGNAVVFLTPESYVASEITRASTLLANTKEGVDPGTFSVATRSALATAISDAEKEVDYRKAYDDIIAAINAYNAAVIVPELSDGSTDKWYYIQGTRPANTYLTSQGSGKALRSMPVVPNDAQLWKFVANGDGFAMVNKETGEYLNADTEQNDDVKSQATIPTNKLRFIVSDIYTDDNTARFWIEHVAGSTPAFRLHAGNGNVLNWNGDAYDNSSWLILDYQEALKVFLLDEITKATNLYTVSEDYEGEVFGKYPAEARAVLNNAIGVAQEVYDNSGASEQAILDATQAIKDAISAFEGSMNLGVEKLLSEDDNKYRWYKIKNRKNSDYLTIVSAELNGQIKTTSSERALKDEDSQLWRFEIVGDKVIIINKAAGLAIKHAASNNVLYTLAETSNASEVTIENYEVYLVFSSETGGPKYFHSGSGVDYGLVRWNNTVEASHWQLEYEKETVKPTRTVTVTVDTSGLGAAIITGSSETSEESNKDVSVTAKATGTNAYFKHWSNEVDNSFVSFANPYIYKGEEDITLVANFDSRQGKVVENPTSESENWFYIYSAYYGSLVNAQALPEDINDARQYVLLADGDNNKAIWGALNGDDGLWRIIEEDGVVKLKNKETNKYLVGSSELSDTGTEVVLDAVADTSPQAYRIKNNGSSYALLYVNYTINRWQSPINTHDQTTWYFVDSGIGTSVDTDATANFGITLNNGRITVTTSETGLIQVYNFVGQNVASQAITGTVNELRTALPTGVYIVQVNGVAQKVIVK